MDDNPVGSEELPELDAFLSEQINAFNVADQPEPPLGTTRHPSSQGPANGPPSVEADERSHAT